LREPKKLFFGYLEIFINKISRLHKNLYYMLK